MVPDTSICDGDVADSEYYTHVQTGCSGQVGPTLTFEWVKSPPDGSCVLPANVTVSHCSWSYPWSDPFVYSLFAVAPLPGLVVLLGIVAMACIDKGATSQRMARANGWLTHGHGRMGNPEHGRMGNVLVVLAYLVVWLGIAAHTVCVPYLMADAASGEASEDTCVARWISVIGSSALVLLAISIRVGEEMAADQRENKRQKRPRLRLAYAAAATLNFFAVIANSVAVLTSTETNSSVAVKSSQMEVVLVGDTFQELELQVTRCRSTTELPSDTFWTIFVPWGLMHVFGLMIHCERIKRGLRISRFPTLVTLLLHSIIAIVMIKESEPNSLTFFVRTPAGIVLGWATLITEVVLPTYQKYMRRLPKPDTLFVVESDGTGCEEVRFSGLLNGSENKAHHLFISYKWKTSYDKVLSLEPHCDFHTVTSHCAVPCPSGTTQVHTLYGKLKLIGGEDLLIWLDTEELKKSGQVDSDSLKRHVNKSLALLVFLSEEYLLAEFCRTELRTADEAGIPIIVVCDDGVTEDTLDKEIQQFKAAKGGYLEEEDEATLRAMEKLKQRVLSQWSAEQKNDAPAVGGGGEIDCPVLWWSRPFVRVALKGVIQQLLECSSSQNVGRLSGLSDGPPRKQSLGSSEGPPARLLFHDELLLLRKEHGKDVSLYVSPDYPPDRNDELQRAFKEAGTNLNITVSITSTRGPADHSVLLLYPASGLKWVLLGRAKPKSWKELVNPSLSEALKSGRSRTFTEDEWKAFDITTLHGDSFIKSGDYYFGPANRGFFGTKGLASLAMLETQGNTPAPLLLYSTDMAADMSEHRLEGTRMLGVSDANQVFTPMWSAWPEVASLQTAAAEEKLHASLRLHAAARSSRNASSRSLGAVRV